MGADDQPEFSASANQQGDASSSQGEGHNTILFMPMTSTQVTEPDVQDSDAVEELSRPARPRSEEQLEKARLRQAVFLQKRRDKKRRKVFLHRLKMLLRFCLSLVLLAGLYGISILPYWSYSAEDFQLHGGHLVTSRHLARYIEPYDGKPIYQINPHTLEKAIIKDFPLLEQVYIRRHLFPVGIDITVTEKPSWGVLYANPPEDLEDGEQPASFPSDPAFKPTTGKPIYLLHWDNSLTDLADYSLTPKELARLNHPVPLVVGNAQIQSDMLDKYRRISLYLDSQPGLARLQYLDVSNPYDIYARFDGFLVRIGRADSSVLNRLDRLFDVIPAIRENQDRIQMVDLRWHQQVLFKKKSPEQIAREKQQAVQKAKSALEENTLEDAPVGAQTDH